MFNFLLNFMIYYKFIPFNTHSFSKQFDFKSICICVYIHVSLVDFQI